jgi:hypothetical protein
MSAFVGLLVMVLAPTVTAQDAVEIKFAQPKVGERVKVTVEEQTERIVKGKPIGPKDPNGTTIRSFVYVDEPLEIAPGAAKPTRLKRTYEKATIELKPASKEEDSSSTLPFAGKSVLIEKKGEKYTFSMDGMALTSSAAPEDMAARVLTAEFNLSRKQDPQALLLPNKPVKPGDTWKLDTDKVIRTFLSPGPKPDKTKLEATGKLVKVYKVGDAQFGAFELKVIAPIPEQTKVPNKEQEGLLSVTLTAELCIDGTTRAGKITIVQKVKYNVNGVDVVLALETNTTETRTMELVKK